jgi:hypothetical protein
MIFSILTPVITENQEALKNIQIKLINLIYDEENIVDNVANFLLNAYRSVNSALKQLTVDTIILLIHYVNQKTNVNSEGQAIKNV